MLIYLAIDRPIPVPPYSREVLLSACTKGSKSRGCKCSGMPIPAHHIPIFNTFHSLESPLLGPEKTATSLLDLFCNCYVLTSWNRCYLHDLEASKVNNMSFLLKSVTIVSEKMGRLLA
jgi:hypothetical protein